MDRIDRYLHAATRDNTRRSYRAAVEHYEVSWGGFLPATASSIAEYLADHADSHAINTLKQRLAGLAQWHIEQGFPDPTKASLVKKVLKGIRELHPIQVTQAKPLQLKQLVQLIEWLEGRFHVASVHADAKTMLVCSRNKALVLLGFWRGFRGDELTRLTVEHIQVFPGEGITLYLPRTKSDRQNLGRTYNAPALSRLCPVTAYQDWLQVSRLSAGPVFRRIDRWGNLTDTPLNPNSVIALLRRLFRDAELPEPDSYSSHSLRRGFATWANENGWAVQDLMEYVGWKDIKSAMRYIDRADAFSQNRIESSLSGGEI